MSGHRCPGQDMRNWKPEDIFCVACPSCGAEVEFWKDEPFRLCEKCSLEIRNPRIDLGCVEWCQSVEKCLGAERAGVVVEALMCDRLIAEVKRAFREDDGRVKHALEVLDNATQLAETEGADAFVVKAAAALLDIGWTETPDAVRAILGKLKVDAEDAGRICGIIDSCQEGSGIDTHESRIVWDAYWLAKIPREHTDTSKSDLAELIDKVFRTLAGRELARRRFLRG